MTLLSDWSTGQEYPHGYQFGIVSVDDCGLRGLLLRKNIPPKHRSPNRPDHAPITAAMPTVVPAIRAMPTVIANTIGVPIKNHFLTACIICASSFTTASTPRAGDDGRLRAPDDFSTWSLLTGDGWGDGDGHRGTTFLCWQCRTVWCPSAHLHRGPFGALRTGPNVIHRAPTRLSLDTLRGMCKQTTCTNCKRPSWSGCGARVEQVLGHVPPGQRCQCRTGTPAASQRQPDTRLSWLRRLRQTRSTGRLSPMISL